jgi:hypothetical protein
MNYTDPPPPKTDKNPLIQCEFKDLEQAVADLRDTLMAVLKAISPVCSTCPVPPPPPKEEDDCGRPVVAARLRSIRLDLVNITKIMNAARQSVEL